MSVIEVRHDRHRRRVPWPDEHLLALPEAQPVIARIAAAVPVECPRWMEQVRLAATIAVKAKMHPSNPYARATL